MMMRRGSPAGRTRTHLQRKSRAAALGAAAAAVLLALAAPAPALGALTITNFTATPNTAPAGSHPDSTVTMDFGGGVSDDVKDIIQHYPGGIIPNPQAIPKCPQSQFALGSCPANTQLGT